MYNRITLNIAGHIVGGENYRNYLKVDVIDGTPCGHAEFASFRNGILSKIVINFITSLGIRTEEITGIFPSVDEETFSKVVKHFSVSKEVIVDGERYV